MHAVSRWTGCTAVHPVSTVVSCMLWAFAKTCWMPAVYKASLSLVVLNRARIIWAWWENQVRVWLLVQNVLVCEPLIRQLLVRLVHHQILPNWPKGKRSKIPMEKKSSSSLCTFFSNNRSSTSSSETTAVISSKTRKSIAGCLSHNSALLQYKSCMSGC